MEYNFNAIEQRWQEWWEQNNTYKVESNSEKPKYYVLEMFPYPSGAGLHVGHPLGYIAGDIYARYKRLKGFNVLHPMGFDAFGLPAEQYAIQTGQHPAVTTAKNIAKYKQQLKQMGFGYDWSREVITSDPQYYKWTQWIFLQLFNNWYNNSSNKAESIDNLISVFEKEGNKNVNAATDQKEQFTAEDWKGFDEKKKSDILLNYRLAYLAWSDVNWCPALGTVLANDEVQNGLSVRGGHPVVKKPMRQWFLRITAYAQRLLDGLETIDWSEALKDMQRNWIGRSEGASIFFDIEGNDEKIEVFTTRPDTIFGSTFMVLAPEHKLVDQLTTDEQKEKVEEYKKYVESRSERDRLADVDRVTGAFTGSYAINPFTKKQIPVWIAEYVIASYGTGAIMAVPAHDERDYKFAKKFGLEIKPVIEGSNIEKEAFEGKEGKMINSPLINGMEVKDAISKMVAEVEQRHMGKGKINYRMRDAGFSRQRYWGEPFPIVFQNNIPKPLDENELPVTLPEVDSYQPTGSGDAPLAALEDWVHIEKGQRETDTMPGYAGSSWYFLRYMDPHNKERFTGEKAIDYWENVDLYIGGAEHAVGHLLYARFWHKFLFDLGLVKTEEPFKKMVNQGMIQGKSSFVYRIEGTNKFVSRGLKDQFATTAIHADISMVDNEVLDIEAFKKWSPDFANAEFELEDGKYFTGTEVEKMSKSKYNVVNPDDIIEEYGADTLRMYEMFLGPIEQHKPWDTKGIDGVAKFLRKFWRLFFNEKGEWQVSDETPAPEELKVLHKTISKVQEDIEKLSFNTSVAAFMICVNDLQSLKCNKRAVLQELVILLAPFAPHITEELWHRLGNEGTVNDAPFPIFNEDYVKENTFEYPVSINGKMRTKIELPLDLPKDQVEERVLDNEIVQKWLEGNPPKKFIFVPGKIVNLVV